MSKIIEHHLSVGRAKVAVATKYDLRQERIMIRMPEYLICELVVKKNVGIGLTE